MRKFVLLFLLLFVMICFVGCGYDLVEIKSHESAYLIPLEGDTTEQGVFDSEEFLNEKKVAGKRVKIEKKWYKTKFKILPIARLITIDRTPVVREWTSDSGTGSSKENQAVIAKGSDTIAILANFNCIAKIEEKNASKFLYHYPSNKKLSEVMDDEIRIMTEKLFVAACSTKTRHDIMKDSTKILEIIEKDLIKHFEKQGISLTIGYKGGLSYFDQNIQKGINNKISAKEEEEKQKIVNSKNEAKAASELKIANSQQEVLDKIVRLKQLEIEKLKTEKFYENWDGKLPQYNASGNEMLQMPLPN